MAAQFDDLNHDHRVTEVIVEEGIRCFISSMKVVLVVEDDLSMCWLLKNILNDKYKVVTKNNGLEALSWLSVQHPPDLILTDIRMPVIDGLELLEHLSHSALYKNIPVIVLSGLEDPSTRKRCLDLGAYAYLAKPFKPRDLLDEVDQPFVSKMFL
jgi:two-component system chemotaxis response regulator CheY